MGTWYTIRGIRANRGAIDRHRKLKDGEEKTLTVVAGHTPVIGKTKGQL